MSNHGIAADFKIYLHYSRNNVQDGMLTLQKDFDSLVSIANFWNLFLSDSQCVVMRFSHFFLVLKS